MQTPHLSTTFSEAKFLGKALMARSTQPPTSRGMTIPDDHSPACLPRTNDDGLTVTTSTGIFTGLIEPSFRSVRQFRNIPYALPPIGSQRWLPPQKRPNTTNWYDATRFPPSCPQYASRTPSVWALNIPEWLIYDGNENTTAGLFARETSEDCLSLAVWTPVNAAASSKLPVIMFMTGGGMVTGGIEIPVQLPTRWVESTQSHIVVTINYRVNIMGYPNAAGLSNQNLGLLDQRAALEWVQSHIAAFGGDPEAIILWGQSAGSRSVDYQNFAFYDNPIARGFFMQSGNTNPLAAPTNVDYMHSNFSFVARNLGCDYACNATLELECMRKVPVSEIENFVGQYQDNSTLVNTSQPAIQFVQIPDEKIVFANYSARYAEGKVSKIPAISSNCANEEVSLVPYPVNNVTEGPNKAITDATTLTRFVCPTLNTSALRYGSGLTTYRYQFAGNFSNISPLPWMGAYHASDLTMNFGTYDVVKNPPSELEVMTSESMQDFIFAFVKDPENGPKKMGWQPWQPGNEGTVLRFGADGKVVQNVSALEIDGQCLGLAGYVYDSSP